MSAGSVDVAERAGRVLRREGLDLFRAVGSIRLPEFLLFALVIADVVPVPGGHGSELFLLAICLLALFRRPRYELGNLQLLVPLFVIALTYVGLVSLAFPEEIDAADWRFRLIRMSAVTVMAFVLATGRIDLRSGILGVGAAAAVNIPLFYAGLVPDLYDGYLTGFFGDKNFAGLVYAAFGILTTGLVTRIPAKVLVYAAFAAPLWLTGSRTSLAAYAAAAVWMLIGARLPLIGKIALGALTIRIVDLTSEDYSRIGVFSDRVGSDLLRSRIDAASRIKVEESGFFGRGLGTAYVHIQDRDWFFHNSYWTALVEGGWPWTVFVVGVSVLVMFQPFRRSGEPVLPVVVGAGVVVLVTATRLGEVFYTVPWGMALGYAMQGIVRARRVADGPPEAAGIDGGIAPVRRPGEPGPLRWDQ